MQGEDQALTDGFWRELFLLRPEDAALHRLLDGLSPDALLHHEVSSDACSLEAHLLTSILRSPLKTSSIGQHSR